MGLFSKKVVGECFFCHKEILSLAVLLNGSKMGDGNYICYDCIKEYNVSAVTVDKTNAVILKNRGQSKELIKNGGFIASKVIKADNGFCGGTGLLEVDEKNELINIPTFNFKLFGKNKSIPNIKLISQIVDFEYMEDGETITNGNSIARGGAGGLLGLATGGALLGGVCAIVGSGSNKKKSKGICNSMKVKITFNDVSDPVAYIDFIKNGSSVGTDINKGGFTYKKNLKTAQECMSVLAVLREKSKSEILEGSGNLGVSTADELLKFKQLLDMGVITQEEFAKKKMELLN